MNRADKRLAESGQAQRRVTVGFALMTLQRRLASSPAAIFRSLERRRERLEKRLALVRQSVHDGLLPDDDDLVALDDDAWDELYEESPQDEREEIEQALLDHATAAVTVEELQLEIARLRQLEKAARAVRRSGDDAKWGQLKEILDHSAMTDPEGNRRKLIVFTEFRDTLTYLAERVRTLLGRHEAVVLIHGGTSRQARRRVVQSFMNDPGVLILVANDAAGEGVNLQRAHLMVNYDLPWNPNRLEQRFGRIHHARRLQPHFIRSFFRDAFERLGGRMNHREKGRFEITHVPQDVRQRGRLLSRSPVVRRYDNGLVVAWPEVERLASRFAERTPEQSQLPL